MKRTITIAERTPVIIELDKELSSSDAKVGTVIEFHVVRSVNVDGATLIVNGSRLSATILNVKPPGNWEWQREGEVELELGSVEAVDGSPVRLRFPRRETREKTSAKSKTVTVIAAPVVGLIALHYKPEIMLEMYKKGPELVVPAGERFEVYVAEKATITVAP